jgi:uncharacterized protein (DUF1499 family)
MNVHQETMRQPVTIHGTVADYIAESGFAIAVLAGIAAAFSGIGSRLGWWHFMTGFTILRTAAIAGFVAAIVSLLGGILARQEHRRAVFFYAAAGILTGLIVAGIPWSWFRTAQLMPRIHDISTDTKNPPRFKAIMPLRKNAENSLNYGGPGVAMQQKAAYADIRPLLLPLSSAKTFDRALILAKSMGWKIVDSNARDGRIEAEATTFWFGFTDAVIVRVSAAAGGSKVDVRSVSRVGLSDVGTNAKRIRAYLDKLARTSNIGMNYNDFNAGY